MCGVTFKRVAEDEARILADNEYVGEVYRQNDVLREGAMLSSFTLKGIPEAGAACMIATAPTRSAPSASGPIPFGADRRGRSCDGDLGASLRDRAIRSNRRSLALPSITAPIPRASAR